MLNLQIRGKLSPNERLNQNCKGAYTVAASIEFTAEPCDTPSLSPIRYKYAASFEAGIWTSNRIWYHSVTCLSMDDPPIEMVTS